MPSGRNKNRFDASRLFSKAIRLRAEHCTQEPRYCQVLVPTGLNVADSAALRLGFELASLHQAALTVLHVLPPPKRASASEGLEVIGLLHDAADDLRTSSAAGSPSHPVVRELREFVEEVVSERLRDDVPWQVECRPGTVAKTIASYANDAAADLVVLSAKPPPWWLPITPHIVRTIESRAQANVIVIRKPTAAWTPPQQAYRHGVRDLERRAE